MAKIIKVPEATLALNSPKQMAEFATELKSFIIQQRLYSNIVGKNFVHVEGWQFALAVMGTLPHLVSCVKLDREDEVAYEAHIELRTLNGEVVGSGIAICSNKESKKKNFDEYAIASMAQTRAVGKAARLTFGWLMKMAGYEATPAEEVDDQMIMVNGQKIPKPTRPATLSVPTSSVSETIMGKRKETNGKN